LVTLVLVMLAGLVDLGIEVAGQEVVLQGVVPALDPGFAGAPAPRTSTTLADFYGSFVAIVYGSAGMLAAEAD